MILYFQGTSKIYARGVALASVRPGKGRGWAAGAPKLRSCEQREEMKRPKLFKDSKIQGDCCERNGQAKRFAGLEIDDQIDLGGLLHRPGGFSKLRAGQAVFGQERLKCKFERVKG